MKRHALFLDRDGTLVYPIHYPSRPDELCLYAGLGPELRALQSMGFVLVVITNQAGLAMGYFTTDDLTRMHRHLSAELKRLGVNLAGIYHCPHHPQGKIAELTMTCACRKPRPGLLQQAAADLDIDLARSWFVGDILDDIEAGKRAGCSTILVDLGTEAQPEHFIRQPDFVACNTVHALQMIQDIENGYGQVDLSYQPLSWRPLDAWPQMSGALYD
ncbi:MAG TPA: HAD family hydrolase [Ktedonobacteraceae bacterium]|nr:HAD family hydrolase [Ktedonobacteraceae bacterium]